MQVRLVISISTEGGAELCCVLEDFRVVMDVHWVSIVIMTARA